MPHTGKRHSQHSRVKYHRGSAADQMCVDWSLDDRGAHPAADWSHVHDTDPDDVANYVPRCRKHHYAYDRDTKVVPVHDRPHTEEAKRKMREAVRPPITEEAKRKMSESQRRRRERERAERAGA
jgi:hypothetical protein